MHVGGILLACVPIPVASLKLLPIFFQQKGYLTVYSSLLCFLLVAFMFSIRHRLAHHMFSADRFSQIVTLLPGLFIVSTVACIIGYHEVLNDSLSTLRRSGVISPTDQILRITDASEIPNSTLLSVYYLGIFVSAECAFVLMALKEYLQDAMKLKELDLLTQRLGSSRTTNREKAATPKD